MTLIWYCLLVLQHGKLTADHHRVLQRRLGREMNGQQEWETQQILNSSQAYWMKLQRQNGEVILL